MIGTLPDTRGVNKTTGPETRSKAGRGTKPRPDSIGQLLLQVLTSDPTALKPQGLDPPPSWAAAPQETDLERDSGKNHGNDTRLWQLLCAKQPARHLTSPNSFKAQREKLST